MFISKYSVIIIILNLYIIRWNTVRYSKKPVLAQTYVRLLIMQSCMFCVPADWSLFIVKHPEQSAVSQATM